MSAPTERLTRGLTQIADRATASPTAWAEIQERVANQPDGPSGEVIDISFDVATSGRRRWYWPMAVAAVVVLALAGGSLLGGVADRSLTAGAPPADWSPDAVGPGTFRTTGSRPAMVVTLPDGWISGEAATDGAWTARLPVPDRPPASQAAVSVFHVDADTPAEIIEAATRRGFGVTDPEQVVVGGVPGQRYEVESGHNVFLTSPGDDDLVIFPNHEATRVTLLSVGDRVVAISEYAPQGPIVAPEESPETLAFARAQTEELIASIQWLDE